MDPELGAYSHFLIPGFYDTDELFNHENYEPLQKKETFEKPKFISRADIIHCLRQPNETLELIKTNEILIANFISRFERYPQKILIENCNLRVAFIPVSGLLKYLIEQLKIVNGGLIYSWTYNGCLCNALLDWNGCWNLRTFAPKYKNSEEIDLLFNEMLVNVIEWNESLYMYNIMLDTNTNTNLESLSSNALGSTFKTLSYCVRYVNTFIEKLNNFKIYT